MMTARRMLIYMLLGPGEQGIAPNHFSIWISSTEPHSASSSSKHVALDEHLLDLATVLIFNKSTEVDTVNVLGITRYQLHASRVACWTTGKIFYNWNGLQKWWCTKLSRVMHSTSQRAEHISGNQHDSISTRRYPWHRNQRQYNRTRYSGQYTGQLKEISVNVQAYEWTAREFVQDVCPSRPRRQ